MQIVFEELARIHEVIIQKTNVKNHRVSAELLLLPSLLYGLRVSVKWTKADGDHEAGKCYESSDLACAVIEDFTNWFSDLVAAQERKHEKN